MMRLELVKRTHKSRLMSVLSPLLAVAATVVFAGVVFAAQGQNPFTGVWYFFL